MMTKESDVIAREGYVILVVSWLLAAALCYWHVLACAVGALWFLFCVYFFRNPSRIKEYEEGMLIAPADGKVVYIGEAVENHFLKRPMQRICIFMSPFNVHMNRSPANGKVLNASHFSGRFLAAFDKNAGDQNERAAVHLDVEGAGEIVFVQVAGWFARRIVTYPNPGDELMQGHIMGLIRFGSRMDIYYDSEFRPQVAMNQKVKAGETVIAVKNRSEAG